MAEFQKYRITPRVIKDLKKRSIVGIFFYPVIVFIVLFTDNYYERHIDFSTQFLILIAVICFVRICHMPFAGRVQSRYQKIDTAFFCLSIVLTALIWGVGFAKFMAQAGEPNAKLLMVMCTAGLCSGGVVAYTPEFRLSAAFSMSMILPAVVTMILNQENLPLVFLLSLFLMYMFLMGYRGYSEYWRALENEHLLDEKSKALKQISQIDGLTGLHNRRYFDEAFSIEWSRAVRNRAPLSVIIGDIDNFKRINDQYGHPAGDAYLKEFAGLFKQVFKRKTDITARYGGEEFIVLMSGESAANAATLAEAARAMTQDFQLTYEGQPIATTVSFGVATRIPGLQDKKQRLISKADKALYESKTGGRNRVTALE